MDIPISKKKERKKKIKFSKYRVPAFKCKLFALLGSGGELGAAMTKMVAGGEFCILKKKKK